MKLNLGHNIYRLYWLDNSKPSTRCQIGEDKFLIKANGEVTYCAALKSDRFGNIRDNALSYFWNEHPFVIEARSFLGSGFREMNGKCNTCEILEDCRGGCIAQRLYEYNELRRGPDPLCCRKPTKKP
jgi:radical SAM protein with 4Fe4S-binding SPASM domain